MVSKTSPRSRAADERHQPDNEDGAAERTAKAAANSTWGDRLVRVGIASRGVVFVILGYLVARIAFGALGSASTSRPASGPGVAVTLAAQPGGEPLLFVLAVGLVLFALFSLLDAILHHDDEESDVKRWGGRFVNAWACVIYIGFAIYCFMTAVSQSAATQRASKSDSTSKHWSAKVLNWPGGPFWLGLAGCVVIIIAIVLAVQAVMRTFEDRLDNGRMSRTGWRWVVVTGTVGHFGRAVLFATVGWFVTSAAVEDDPRHGQGVDGAARLLADNTLGAIFLTAIAATLVVFGVYLFFEAKYRKV